jgi:hypothetical protein
MLKSIRAALTALFVAITLLPQAACASPAPTTATFTAGSSIGAIAASRRRSASLPAATVAYDAAVGNGVDTNGFANLPLRTGAHRYFVKSGTGSDANTCTAAQSPSTPKATIASAAGCITQGNGDQVLVAQGTSYAEGLPNVDFDGGFSPTYPTVFQSYDPADALNEAKYGRATGSNRPVINTGATASMALTCCATSPASYLAFRGFDFNPGNLADMVVTITASNGLPNSYVLVENNIFRYTMLSINEAVDSSNIPLGGHVVVRGNSFYGTWSPTNHSQGVFAAGINGFTAEDNVFDHIGWKIGGAGRDSSTEGATIFRHSVYWQDNGTNGVIRRNLFIDPSATGCSCRADATIAENVFIDNPISIIGGTGDNYNTIRPNGVDLHIYRNAILGDADITSSLPRGTAINGGNGRPGSNVDHNLIARSRSPSSNVPTAFSTAANFDQPSYFDFHDNVEYSWANAGHVIGTGATFPAQVHEGYERNAWSDPASGTNINIASYTAPNAYTASAFYVALGLTDKTTAVAHWINNPDEHPARAARALLFAGYGVTEALGPLTLDRTFTRGTAVTGAILGAVTGSTITASGLPSEITINGTQHSFAFSNAGSGAASGSFTLTETLAGEPGSPRASTVSYSIAALTAYRAIRIHSTASMGGGTGLAVAEISIWAGGSNVTSGATVSAAQTGNGAAANAVDSNLSTFWGTNFDNTWPQDFVFDLGATSANWKTFNRVDITSRAGGNNLQAPGNFTIDVTTDDPAGTPTWTTKATMLSVIATDAIG